MYNNGIKYICTIQQKKKYYNIYIYIKKEIYTRTDHFFSRSSTMYVNIIMLPLIIMKKKLRIDIVHHTIP